MIIDIILLAIFVITVAVNLHRGFIPAVAKLLSGVVSIVIAYIFCGKAVAIIEDRTSFLSLLSERIARFITMHVQTTGLYNSIPEVFREATNGFTEKLAVENADKLAGISLSIICFVVILLVLRFFLGFISGIVVKSRNEDGAIGKTDRLLALLVGCVLGIINVFILLALIFPVTDMFFPESAAEVMAWFDSSRAAQDLYDNNLLLILAKGMLKKF